MWWRDARAEPDVVAVDCLPLTLSLPTEPARMWCPHRMESLRCHGESAHAAAHAGEGGVVDSDGFEGADDHGGDQGGRGRRVFSQDIVAGGIKAELREEGGTHGAPFAWPRAFQAAGFGACAEHVHEETKLVVDVQSRVG